MIKIFDLLGDEVFFKLYLLLEMFGVDLFDVGFEDVGVFLGDCFFELV